MKSSGDSRDSGASAMSIGALAARFGLATHVLRHWESMGLLHPVRDAGGRRRYGAGDLTRVATILVLKEAGLGLGAIRSLSASTDRAARHEILRAEAEDLRRRIAAARASLELIEGGLHCEHEDITECPDYRRRVAEQIRSRVPDADRPSGAPRTRAARPHTAPSPARTPSRSPSEASPA
ncbi:MerR family transcriptional regulator [Streptomyces coelicoflavus]|uniref:MerR family transcriptional regulator n=1 Tax=Streptomyces TaxID=1883 RepID=UPI001F089357|nr:MerR family transcriptional regulator [Streptomyces sp. OM5714]